MNTELPPLKNGECNSENASTLDRVITPLSYNVITSVGFPGPHHCRHPHTIGKHCITDSVFTADTRILSASIVLQIAYSLLKRLGFSALELKNEKGERPADRAKGEGCKHRALHHLLDYAATEVAQGAKFPRPPNTLWTWYFLLPIVLYLAGVAVGGGLQYAIGR